MILDLMICVASAALSVVWLQQILPALRSVFPYSRSGKLKDYMLDLANITNIIGGCLFWASVGVTIIRLVPPRPSIRRLARQPGFVACLSVSIAGVAPLAVSVAQQVGRALIGWTSSAAGTSIPYMSMTVNSSEMAGAGVAALWGILALRRRVRIKADWVEYTARTLGFAWIAHWVLFKGLAFVWAI